MNTLSSRGFASFLLLFTLAVLPGCRRETPAAAAPEPLAVAVSLEPAQIRVGDRARLNVIVDHPGDGNLELPEIDQGKAVVVLERARMSQSLAGEGSSGRQRTSFVMVLTSFKPGDHRVGDGKITLARPGGAILERPFPSTLLRTKSVLQGAATPLRPSKALARWPVPTRLWLAWAAVLPPLAAGLILVARRLRSRGQSQPTAPPQVVPPHVKALKALAELRAKQLIERDQVEAFHQELSALVRRYLEERYGLRAPERTTEEFIREATGSGRLTTGHQELVSTFLVQCDLVKFARHRPVPADMVLAFEAARRLIAETATLPPGGAGT